jgi:hypothetical protein
MVTGVEIASLVLATLSLLISAMEHQDLGLEPFNVLFFRKKHNTTVQGVLEEHKLGFRQCYEKILSMADVENIADLVQERDRAKMVKLWDTPDMRSALDSTFGDDLGVIWHRVKEIQMHVDRLEKYTGEVFFLSS